MHKYRSYESQVRIISEEQTVRPGLENYLLTLLSLAGGMVEALTDRIVQWTLVCYVLYRGLPNADVDPYPVIVNTQPDVSKILSKYGSFGEVPHRPLLSTLPYGNRLTIQKQSKTHHVRSTK